MTIGIITLSFNQGQFLKEAIASVAVSGDSKVEYIIVDPGSKDGSREMIAALSRRFLDTVLEPDSGPADGLNKGFARLQRAEICGYLNADDRFVPGALDYVCKYFEKNPSIDVLLGGISIIDQEGAQSIRARRAERVSLRAYAEGTCRFWQQGTFFRRSALERTAGFNVQNRTCWDAELAVDMLIAGARVGYTKRVLGEFRLYPTSISGSNDAGIQKAYRLDQARVVDKIYSAGYRPRPALLQNAARLVHRVNPFRHLANVCVGVSAIARRSSRTFKAA